ncbi:beta strand repeat-containing protein [Arthrobacter bambusae]
MLRFRRLIAIFAAVLATLLFGGNIPAQATVAATATISGTVTAPAGVNLTSVFVYASPVGSISSPAYAPVAADGTYKITGLPAGNYNVQFSGYNSGALDQWYRNATTQATATAVTVTTGQDVTGINATLVKGATISGTITAPAGVNLTSVYVYASTVGSTSGSTYNPVGADGTYKITGLPAGNYNVQFTGNSGALGQWYQNATTQATATAVTVTTGQDVTGINATLVKGATISGTITAPAGVNLTSVYAYVTPVGSTSSTASAPVGADGTYKITGLPAGNYNVQFSGYNSGALGQWYQNATTQATATAVTVTTGQDVTGINATLVKGATISGTITAPAGVNLTSVYVSVTPVGSTSGAASASVGADGTYKITGLPAGNYNVQFSGYNSGALDQWYQNATTAATATAVTVTTSQDVTGINATLVKGATISGTITAPAGVNLTDTSVSASPVGSTSSTVSSPVGADGTYKLIGLPAGNYNVDFYNDRTVDQWYKNASSAATATAVTVTAQQDVTGIDATLVKGATISGTITGVGTGGYLPVTVQDEAGNPVKTGFPDYYSSGGTYTINGLATGSYKIAFNRASGSSLAEAQFYQNKPESAGAGAATLLTVTAGQTVPNVNAALVTGGSTSGTVTDDKGQALPNALIHAYTSDGSLVTRSTRSDAAGKFSVTGLTTGKYLVDVTPINSSLGKLYYGNVSTEAASTPVSVTVGKDTAVGEITYKVAASPQQATPAPVVFTDKDGTQNDTYTVPATTGVDYLVGGKIIAAGTYPGTGTVTVTAQAQKGYALASGATATWSATFSTGTAPYTPPAASPFTDVSTGQQFYKEMAWMSEKGISTGWAEGGGARSYRPLQSISRDAMAAFLYRMAGSPAYTPPAVSPFTDVSTGQQFYKEMAWMSEKGISTGWAEGGGARSYRPLQSISRDAMAAFLYRMAGSPAYTPPAVSPFTDVSTGQQFYKEMAWMSEKGISTGWAEGGGARSYRPLQSISRDAMAAFLYRLSALQ